MTDAPFIELDIEHWREGAACHDAPDVDFFPAPDDLGAITLAKAVCENCPVVDDCLTFAIETRQPDGIWGGLSAKERTRVRRRWLEEFRRAS